MSRPSSSCTAKARRKTLSIHLRASSNYRRSQGRRAFSRTALLVRRAASRTRGHRRRGRLGAPYRGRPPSCNRIRNRIHSKTLAAQRLDLQQAPPTLATSRSRISKCCSKSTKHLLKSIRTRRAKPWQRGFRNSKEIAKTGWISSRSCSTQ